MSEKKVNLHYTIGELKIISKLKNTFMMRFSKWRMASFLLTLLITFCGCSSDDEQSSNCDILSFKFLISDNSKLSQDATGVIKDNVITVEVPSGTDISSLVANFTTNGHSVQIGTNVQTSGKTANDFSKPVIYTVTAQDNTTKNYTVSVVRPDRDITSFVFDKANNPQLSVSAVGVISGAGAARTITVDLYEGTDRTRLIPTFDATAATVTVGGVTQVSGQTPCDFTNDVEYVVTAENGSVTTYTVTINEISAQITSFKLEKANNAALPNDLTFDIDHKTKTITAAITKWITAAEPDKFIPTFDLTEGAEASVAGAAQESGVTSLSFKDEVVYTLKSPVDGKQTEYKVRLLCPQINATLPVMRFSVKLSEINSKEDYRKSKLEIIGNGITEGLWSYDKEEVEIRLRGNSTMGLPKKPFRVKFPEKVSPLGLNHATEKNWVLLANDADKTLLRNAVAFAVSRTLLQNESPAGYHHKKAILFTAATQHVDVYVGDEYQGVYHLTDQVQRNPGRVDLKKPASESSDPNISGGYLMELDGFASGEFSWFRTGKGMEITLKHPDMEDEYTDKNAAKQDPRYKYISQYVQDAENALFSSGYQDATNGWRKYFDQSTVIDYYLISEFCGNSDAWWSTYMYKLRDGDSPKLFFGPVWDFDIAFDNDNRINNAVNTLMLNMGHAPRTWVARFFTDPTLQSAVKARWNQMKDRMRSNALAVVEEDAAKISVSREANFRVWDITRQNLGHGKPGPATYEEGITHLKNYINNRYTYLDGVFNGW